MEALNGSIVLSSIFSISQFNINLKNKYKINRLINSSSEFQYKFYLRE